MHLEARFLLKQYDGHVALDMPQLHVPAGTTFGLVGSNGAGKTTFLRLLLNLLTPDRGAVLLDGLNVAQTSRWQHDTGSYLNESFLLDFLTADEYFSFVGALYGLDGLALTEALAPYQSFYPDETFGATRKLIRSLSMGNRKKIGIIAALMIQPRLLILDEPFANLDPGSQIRLKELIIRLATTHGTTSIISSHDLLHVTDLCERIAVLENGHLVRDLRTSDATRTELEAYFAGRGL